MELTALLFLVKENISLISHVHLRVYLRASELHTRIKIQLCTSQPCFIRKVIAFEKEKISRLDVASSASLFPPLLFLFFSRPSSCPISFVRPKLRNSDSDPTDVAVVHIACGGRGRTEKDKPSLITHKP